MNKLLIFLFIPLMLISCKAYEVTSKPNEMQYTNFRSTQKKWDSPQGTIAYIDKGEGIPLLLLHGVPTSGWLYRNMIDPLVAQGYRVIVPDMLGFGNSDHPKGYEIYSKTAHAKRILGLMEHLKITNWHHLMHDAGGLWTWELFKLAPNKINRLSILNTIIYKEGFCPPVKMKKGISAKLVMWIYKNNTNMMLKKLFKDGTTNVSFSKAEIEGYKMPFKEGKTDAIYTFFTTNTAEIPDYSETLKNIQIPVQVIWGINDAILQWKPESKRVMEDLNIDETNVHVLNYNHFLQEDTPQELVKLIGAFKE